LAASRDSGTANHPIVVDVAEDCVSRSPALPSIADILLHCRELAVRATTGHYRNAALTRSAGGAHGG